MRAIKKTNNGGKTLNARNSNPPQTSKDAETEWGKFRKTHAKKQEEKSLLEEQFYLCCYSEIRSDELGFGYHIEHIENKSQNPQRTFYYGNLAASALSSADLTQLKPTKERAFGGHFWRKQNKVNMTWFISCHESDCNRYFAFVSDGRIIPARNLKTREKRRAIYTICLLNLNSPYLVALRQDWWSELEKLPISPIITYLIPNNSDGKLNRFFSLTRQFFGQIAEQTLQQHAPH
jgi:uncharacterized protein (TIGR02646 family)